MATKKNNAENVVITIKQPRDGSLAMLIETEANKKFADAYSKNLRHKVDGRNVGWKEDEWNAAKQHHDICSQLVELSRNNNNFPYTALVYFAVGSDAHKKPVFEKGYKQINIDKAKTILKWLAMFAKYNKNPKFYTCEKIVHAFAKFYDTHSKKDKDFKVGMNAFTPMPAPEHKASQFKTMQQFYELFYKPFITIAEVDEKTNKVVKTKTVKNPLKKK